MSASSHIDLQGVDGIIPIYKEAGWTSNDVVMRLRRITRQRRIGHAGTLDPTATGVLPVCLGQATRVVEYLSDAGKAYRGTIRFGATTDTYDAAGSIVSEQPVPALLTREEIAAYLPRFTGNILQVPPMYSALKHDGKRLYDLARQGIEVERPARPVHIDSLTIIDWVAPDLTLDIDCGKGTYIRSLAHDLGMALGIGAHLVALERRRVGPFAVAQCVTLDQVAASLDDATWWQHLYAPDEALLTMCAAIVNPDEHRYIVQGRPISFANSTGAAAASDRLRAYSRDGQFIAILERIDTQTWHPLKVFQTQV